jgi:hypothetical protein
MNGFATEHDFTLPKGYVDPGGTLHRAGTMRLATAADEILLLQDPRVQRLPAYLIVLLLSRVVTRLGTVPEVHAGVVEGLFAEDLAFLQALYNRVNGLADQGPTTTCPRCEFAFAPGVVPPGESSATPSNGSTRRWPSSAATSTGPTERS